MTTFEQLAGLPGTGPWPEQFTHSPWGTHSEGLVVRFCPSSGASWVGNFQRGFLSLDGVFLHPNGSSVLVVAGGEVFIVDPQSRQSIDSLHGAVQAVYPLNGGKLLVMSLQDLRFEALGPNGLIWSTRRLSYDGFRNLVVTEEEICGEGWTYEGDCWLQFKVDVKSGRSDGGACHQNDAGHDELFDCVAVRSD